MENSNSNNNNQQFQNQTAQGQQPVQSNVQNAQPQQMQQQNQQAQQSNGSQQGVATANSQAVRPGDVTAAGNTSVRPAAPYNPFLVPVPPVDNRGKGTCAEPYA